MEEQEDNILNLHMSLAIREILWKMYEEIKHGDEEHQAWLREKIENFIKENKL